MLKDYPEDAHPSRPLELSGSRWLYPFAIFGLDSLGGPELPLIRA
jgi:hypothetical protein